MLNGLLTLSVWGYVVSALVLTHITIVAVTIFLHRHQAHRALDLHPVVSHFFRFWLWLTTSMITREWVAVHRKHHAKCETIEDPHSPQVLGLRKVLWQGAELYKQEAKNPETLERFGKNTPDDWIERNLYSRFRNLGIAAMFVIDVLLFGPIGITIWAVQMIWVPFWAAGVINGIGHYWGYRNYECADAARNISPIGILIGGEELHNNHHTYGNSAKLSSKPWEFDIGWFYIRVLETLGLAKVNRVAPTPIVDANKTHVDIDTIKALMINRFQIMAKYAQDVIHQVNRDELQKAQGRQRNLLKHARKLLVREESLLDETKKQRLNEALQANPTLRKVYEAKLQLQTMWKRSTERPEVLLAQFQEWCRQAEASGVKSLQEFAASLRRYSLQRQRA
jgi:stearoyl-CoA desaturase (delta-9 desaturase)